MDADEGRAGVLADDDDIIILEETPSLGVRNVSVVDLDSDSSDYEIQILHEIQQVQVLEEIINLSGGEEEALPSGVGNSRDLQLPQSGRRWNEEPEPELREQIQAISINDNDAAIDNARDSQPQLEDIHSLKMDDDEEGEKIHSQVEDPEVHNQEAELRGQRHVASLASDHLSNVFELQSLKLESLEEEEQEGRNELQNTQIDSQPEKEMDHNELDSIEQRQEIESLEEGGRASQNEIRGIQQQQVESMVDEEATQNEALNTGREEDGNLLRGIDKGHEVKSFEEVQNNDLQMEVDSLVEKDAGQNELQTSDQRQELDSLLEEETTQNELQRNTEQQQRVTVPSLKGEEATATLPNNELLQDVDSLMEEDESKNELNSIEQQQEFPAVEDINQPCEGACGNSAANSNPSEGAADADEMELRFAYYPSPDFSELTTEEKLHLKRALQRRLFELRPYCRFGDDYVRLYPPLPTPEDPTGDPFPRTFELHDRDGSVSRVNFRPAEWRARDEQAVAEGRCKATLPSRPTPTHLELVGLLLPKGSIPERLQRADGPRLSDAVKNSLFKPPKASSTAGQRSKQASKSKADPQPSTSRQAEQARNSNPQPSTSQQALEQARNSNPQPSTCRQSVVEDSRSQAPPPESSGNMPDAAPLPLSPSELSNCNLSSPYEFLQLSQELRRIDAKITAEKCLHAIQSAYRQTEEEEAAEMAAEIKAKEEKRAAAAETRRRAAEERKRAAEERAAAIVADPNYNRRRTRSSAGSNTPRNNSILEALNLGPSPRATARVTTLRPTPVVEEVSASLTDAIAITREEGAPSSTIRNENQDRAPPPPQPQTLEVQSPGMSEQQPAAVAHGFENFSSQSDVNQAAAAPVELVVTQSECPLENSTGWVTEDIWEIEEILNSRIVSDEHGVGRRQYLIKWKGWESKYNSWNDESDLQADSKIKTYWRRMLKKTKELNSPISRLAPTREPRSFTYFDF